MLKRLMKMITRVKDDIRVKQAKVEFENRPIHNQRIATYRHKKMLELSRQLREKLKQDPNFSSDDYFATLSEIHTFKGCKICARTSAKKDRLMLKFIKEGIGSDNAENKQKDY